MAVEQVEPQPETPFDVSRKEAKRAQLALNILVVFSAIAGACFFAYVLYTVRPFADTDIPEVNVPTSSVKARLGMLVGKDDGAGVEVVLRDIDEAPEYRDELNARMLADLGIDGSGRLYLLFVRNGGESQVEFKGANFTATTTKGTKLNIQWLGDVANVSEATAVGKMRFAQSTHTFPLAPGEERQLYVYVGGDGTPPSAEDFASGVLRFGSGSELRLEHTEVKLADQ